MKNIPDFLIEMSNHINEQDNRATADPFFEVRHKKYLITEQDYNEHHYEIMDEEGNTLHHEIFSDDYNDLCEHLYDCHRGWCEDWFLTESEEEDRVFNLVNLKTLFDGIWDYDYFTLPYEISKIYLQEIEVTVNTHFTEADAQAFIDRKQHDYPKLYIYATSLYYCENMSRLRRWIKDLTNKEETL